MDGSCVTTWRCALFIFLILLILLITAVQRTGFRVAAVLLLGAVFANSYRAGLKQSVRNAQTIAREQYWMHVFEEQFYRGPVAVNDLGWVSFDHDPAVYVLDLGGLASAEVARAPHKDAAFLREVTQRHGVRLAMIYRAWFPDLPSQWVYVGHISQPPGRGGYTGNPVVSFFATDPSAAPLLRQEMEAFRRIVPAYVLVDVAPAPLKTSAPRE